MFPITITLHNAQQLVAVMSLIAPLAPQESSPSEAPEKSQAKPKSATTARSQPTAEAAQSKGDPSTAAPATSTEVTKQPATANSAADAVDYPTLQKAVAKLFAKDAKAPVQIAKDLGFDTFKAMPADKWADALTAVNSKLAEIEVA